MDIITPGSASVVRKWGRHTDDLYLRLQSLNISDSIVFENQWTKLHQHNPSIPGIPTELFGSDFWNNYDPAV
jgi:hypothetical protein